MDRLSQTDEKIFVDEDDIYRNLGRENKVVICCSKSRCWS